MRIHRRRWLAGMGGSLLLPAAPRAGAVPQPQYRPWPVGRVTPSLLLMTMDDRFWSLLDRRGQPVVLNFWASWCAPCRAEMPSLEHLALGHESQGLQIALVNFKEPKSTVARFVAEMKLELPVLRDTDGAVARAFGVGIFPTTVLIGRDGRAVASVVGEADWLAPREKGWIAALL